ncbi:MAG: hypothetical protein JXR07_02620 [Reichenbachiella sp.]
MKKSAIILTALLSILSQQVMAQCAMCKTTIVNNVSNGELALAEGLNFGIMYLFFSPYLVVFALAGVWLYKYRKHGKQLRSSNSSV